MKRIVLAAVASLAVAFAAGCSAESSGADEANEESGEALGGACTPKAGHEKEPLLGCYPAESLWCRDRDSKSTPADTRCESLCRGGDAYATFASRPHQSSTWIDVTCHCITTNRTRTTRCFDVS